MTKMRSERMRPTASTAIQRYYAESYLARPVPIESAIERRVLPPKSPPVMDELKLGYGH